MNILITGGASGLGEAITCKLAGNKADTIFFTYKSSVSNAAKLEEDFPNTIGIQCDFTDKDSVDSLLTFIGNTDLDILINNAFTSNIIPKHFHKTRISVFAENFYTNIIPVILVTQHAITGFRKKKFGKIINILSTAIIGNPPTGWSEYTAEKAYLASLSKSWATEYVAFNITSNSVSPSFMQTRLTSNTDERVIEEITEHHPLKQLLTTNEVAETVLFLTKCSQQINGTNILMNAGTHVI
jgi:NAD(P)-dependent dehydrogenase (short-subunit alcohol dehydrogenase family)